MQKRRRISQGGRHPRSAPAAATPAGTGSRRPAPRHRRCRCRLQEAAKGRGGEGWPQELLGGGGGRVCVRLLIWHLTTVPGQQVETKSSWGGGSAGVAGSRRAGEPTAAGAPGGRCWPPRGCGRGLHSPKPACGRFRLPGGELALTWALLAPSARDQPSVDSAGRRASSWFNGQGEARRRCARGQGVWCPAEGGHRKHSGAD